MDDFNLDGLDAFTLEMVQRVKSYKKYLDQALNEYNWEDMYHKETSEDHLSPILPELHHHSQSSINSITDENEIMDDELLKFDSNQVRQSIHKLLNVHEPLLIDDNKDQTEIQPKNTNQFAQTRLHQRLNHLVEIYKNQDILSPQEPCSNTKTILQEQNLNVGIGRSQLKERLMNIAQSYYPIKSNNSSERLTNSKSHLNFGAPKLSFNTSELLNYKSVSSDKTIQSENVINTKQTSVKDLKKLFESKIEDESKGIEQIAPELLSLKEKRRFFEKAIREENEARAKQYKKGPLQIHVDWIEKQLEPPLQKERQIESKAILESQIESEKEFKEQSSTVGDNENDQMQAVEGDLIQEVSVVNQPNATLEITFTAIDEPESNSLDNEVSLFYPQLKSTVGSDQMQRSSTHVDLKINDSIDSSCMDKLDLAEEPQEMNIDFIEQKDQINEEMAQLRTISFYRRQKKIQTNQGESLDEKQVYLKQKLNQQYLLDREKFKTDCQQKMVALKEEIGEHNRVLSQANAALNLSLHIADFRYSPSRVEAERLLLVSSEKRMACLNEINRLKTIISSPEWSNKYINACSKGTLFITNVKIPLLNEFLVSRAKAKVANVHYFICLIYHEANVYVSELLDTNSNLSKESLEFDLGIDIDNLNEDFNVIIKIFTFELNTKDGHHGKHKLTPLKSIRRKLMAPSFNNKHQQSDNQGRPINLFVEKINYNFKLIGYVPLTLKNVKTSTNKYYRIDSQCFRSIIDNYLTMNVALKVIHQSKFHGYYDLQEHWKSSFWIHRWFSLEGDQLKFWKFQQSIKDSPPDDCINLKYCINPTVALLDPDQRHIVCMRANTFVLITIEPPAISNAQKLIEGGLISKSEPKIYFISSQCKENILEFCQHLNQILASIRIWENDSVQPYSMDEFDRLLTKTSHMI